MRACARAVARALHENPTNEALRKLDAVVQLTVASATTAAQPGAPADGSVSILPAGKTGACVALLGGCLNMPTPPVQITGSYQSTLQYETHFFYEVWPRRGAFEDTSAR